MQRDVDIKDISDGRFYGLNDMVKVGCNDCRGCSACCHDMEALILDPLDVCRLTNGLGKTFDEMIDEELVLTRVDGLILPKMKMGKGVHNDAASHDTAAGQGNTEDTACVFLNEEGRCSIHPLRPGICRIFPLGRLYEDGDFRYFLQIYECEKKNRYKVRLKQWIDVKDPKTYHAFINTWHYFTKQVGERIPDLTDESAGQVTEYVLRLFYEGSYPLDVFYSQFEQRMAIARRALAGIL